MHTGNIRAGVFSSVVVKTTLSETEAETETSLSETESETESSMPETETSMSETETRPRHQCEILI